MRKLFPFALLFGILQGAEIEGTGAADVLQGTAIDDRIYGASGDDLIQGLSGNDLLFGDEGFDVIEGGEGSDRLIGGRTMLSDDSGNDYSGGAGNDAIWGAMHGDVYRYAPGDGLDLVHEAGSVEGAVDLVIFGIGIVSENVTFGRERGDLIVEIVGLDCIRIESWFAGDAGEFKIEEFHFHDDPMILGADLSFEGTVWVGGPASEVHTATGPSSFLLSGLDGNDTLTGSSGMDVVNGGSGADTLYGRDGDDGIYGDSGGDTLYGENGDDALYGRLANDTLVGGGGADQLTGGADNDIQLGCEGNDTYFWNMEDGDDLVQDDTGNTETNAVNRLVFGPGLLPSNVTPEIVPGSGTHLRFQVRLSGVPAGSVQVNLWNTPHSYTSIRHNRTWRIEFADGTIWDGNTLSTPLADTLTGTNGDDQLSGGAGNDSLIGLDGDDSLAGDGGSDNLYGGNGNDIIEGGADPDTIYGEAGDDSLSGGDHNDMLQGGVGADLLTGGIGNDVQYGGEGNDSYFWNIGDGDDVIQDDTWYTEASAVNRLVFGPGVIPADVTPEIVPGSGSHIKFQVHSSGAPFGSVQVNSWNAPHSYTSIRHSSTWRIEFADGTVWSGSALATPLADVLTGSAGADLISGGAGNDNLSGYDGDDMLWGNAGSDMLNGGNGNDTLCGGADSDTLNGDSGNDILIGEYNNDTLVGGVGMDHLTGGEGNDIELGGEGNDSYFWNAGDGDDVIQDDTGYTEASAVNHLIFGAGVLPSDVTPETVSGSGSHLRLQVRSSGILSGSVQVNFWNTQHIYTSVRHNNTWRIEFANGTIWSGETLATPLADILAGTAGPDQISGGAGNDSLSGLDGNDSLAGDAGADVLYGGAGNDTLDGGADDDILQSGTGSDLLVGGTGSDTLYGEAGNDIYRWNLGNGDDQIIDNTSEYAVGVENRLEFGPDISPSNVEMELVGPNGLKFVVKDTNGLAIGSVTVNSWFLNVTGGTQHRNFWCVGFADGTVWDGKFLATPGTDIFVGGIGDDNLSGAGGADNLSGLDGSDSLAGGAGADILYGGNGNDILEGGSDDDTLQGGMGDDLLVGGTGNDALYGEAGNDIYRWNVGNGDDQITDNTSEYTPGVENSLEFGPDISSSDIEMNLVGSHGLKFVVKNSSGVALGSVMINSWFLTVNGSTQHRKFWKILFSDGTIWDGEYLATPGADILVGGSEDDLLSGAGGIDHLTGNEGNDTLSGNDDSDLIEGNSGNDTLIGGTGDDILNGGTGADIYFWLLGDGNDIITEVFADSANDNTVHLENVLDVGGIDFARDGNTRLNILIPQVGSQEFATISIDNWAVSWNNALFLSLWNLEIAGYGKFRFANMPSSGADLFTGSNDSDLVLGLDGSDDLSGGDEADFLSGGGGNDALNGGDGNDLLSGGTGSDSLYGGPGNDVYFINISGGVDEISEPQIQIPYELNRIVFGRGIDPSEVNPYRSANDLILEYEEEAGMVIVKNWFADGSRSTAVESVTFPDGTTWSRQYVESRTNLSGYFGPYPLDLVEPLQVLPAIESQFPQVDIALKVLTPLCH